ncbi:four helix bundle protein [Microcoleus sp. F10-C6]|uniref:four helix bundle protein n=1 Tax=unclassified Microcoleus TaxID=2642155 RepID=UPI002FD1113D
MSYREQFIWQRGVKLAINCYRLTENFPKSELYGLTSEEAEGWGQKAGGKKQRFFNI